MKKNYAGGFIKMDSLLYIMKNGATGSQPCDLVAIKNKKAQVININLEDIDDTHDKIIVKNGKTNIL